MPTWNPSQYLKFINQRTRPCHDLANAVRLPNPALIIDLGCGSGNSTQVLREHWPNAICTGLDSSEQMIVIAREQYPQQQWLHADITDWHPSNPYDLIFSNAALQWLPNHEQLLPYLLQQVKPGGVFAFQMPANINALPHQLMRDLAASQTWHDYFQQEIREWLVHDPGFYYDILSPQAHQIDIWHSEYFHVLSTAEEIVEWYKGSGLRPFLDLLPPEKQANFLDDYLTLIEQAYPPQANGKTLFSFLRLFVISYKNS